MSLYKYSNKRIGADIVLESINRYNISIVGLGKLGAAIASQLTGCNVKGWDVVDTGHDIQVETLYDCIKDADAIFIVVPAQHFEQLLTNIIREYSKHTCWHRAVKVKFISFTKGFSNNRLPIQILKRQLPFNPVGVISGPMLSSELYDSPTHAMLATNNMDIHERSAIATRMSNLKLHTTDDEIGVTLCGIIKNVYAVGMGMLDGSDSSDNTKACFANMALNEMKSIADDETILSYAGVGDFLATCYSTKSRNFTYGYKLAKKQSTDDIMAEGVNNIDHLIRYVPKDLPIVNTIKSCLMSRSATPLLLSI